MKRTYTTPSGTVYSFHEELLSQKHLMIAGATGSGKSVIVNGLVYTALYRAPGDVPDGVQLILIDPKRVELSHYRDLPHTLCYASEPAGMVQALRLAMEETEARFSRMQREGVKLYQGGDLYLMIDEFADLMTTNAKEVTPLVQRLAQLGRAAKVHIFLCTQCPIAAVIPTKIKCNFDSVAGLHTARAQDSRNILGETGLEALPQYGECLFYSPQARRHYRNIPMIPDTELAARVAHWTEQQRRGFLHRLFH